MTHPLLLRILRKAGATAQTPASAEAWPALVAALHQGFKEADQDRYTLERSIDMCSREMQGLYQDLKRRTDGQLAEKQARLEETIAILRATWEASHEGIVVVDDSRTVLFSNRRYAEMWSIPPEVIEARDHRRIVAHVIEAGLVAIDMLTSADELYAAVAGVLDDEIALHDGRVFARCSAPVQLGDGRIVARVTYFRDVTAERRAHAEIERARSAAEAASQAKSMFLANMSHELRTPLNAVIGLAELLLLQHVDPLSDRQREYLQGIGSSGRHLLAMVNDILDLAKVEAGKHELMLERVAPRRIVDAALAMLQPMARERGIAIEAVTDGSTPDIRADPVRLRQIVQNLLSNAVKFTPRDGRVRVSLTAERDAVAIAVADTGVGIAPENLPRLYRAFEQIPQAAGARPQGTGLGLALTKRLVDMHAGTIDIVSAVGVGTTFTVRIPTWSAG